MMKTIWKSVDGTEETVTIPINVLKLYHFQTMILIMVIDLKSIFSLVFVLLIPECKRAYALQDGSCSQFNFIPECDYDRKDCECPLPELIGDTICDPLNNLRICNYDGLDCGRGCPLNLALYLGNGICNTNANTSKCLYDGGDCL